MEILRWNDITNHKEKMLSFLYNVNHLFKVKLSNKIILEEYIEKIEKNAKVYIVYKKDKIIAAIVY
ncbi:MAG: hypothetical protein ACRC5W_10800, partial [Cetobacterium sp.]